MVRETYIVNFGWIESWKLDGWVMLMLDDILIKDKLTERL